MNTRRSQKETGELRDREERIKWCRHREYQIPLLYCLHCVRFPCRGINAHDMENLENSLFTERGFNGFAERKVKMYIIKTEDGKLSVVDADFSLDQLSGKNLENISEVYLVSKTLVKQVKLVVKDKAEIAAIRSVKSQISTKK